MITTFPLNEAYKRESFLPFLRSFLDDFSQDIFEFNAKSLITTWGGRNSAKTLGDYAVNNKLYLYKRLKMPKKH